MHDIIEWLIQQLNAHFLHNEIQIRAKRHIASSNVANDMLE